MCDVLRVACGVLRVFVCSRVNVCCCCCSLICAAISVSQLDRPTRSSIIEQTESDKLFGKFSSKGGASCRSIESRFRDVCAFEIEAKGSRQDHASKRLAAMGTTLHEQSA